MAFMLVTGVAIAAPLYQFHRVTLALVEGIDAPDQSDRLELILSHGTAGYALELKNVSDEPIRVRSQHFRGFPSPFRETIFYESEDGLKRYEPPRVGVCGNVYDFYDQWRRENPVPGTEVLSPGESVVLSNSVQMWEQNLPPGKYAVRFSTGNSPRYEGNYRPWLELYFLDELNKETLLDNLEAFKYWKKRKDFATSARYRLSSNLLSFTVESTPAWEALMEEVQRDGVVVEE